MFLNTLRHLVKISPIHKHYIKNRSVKCGIIFIYTKFYDT